MELFKYQAEGAEFLSARRTALLADDMGLGKSAQAIAACDAVAGTVQTVLVLCPASLRMVWAREFEKFSRIRREIVLVTSKKPPRSGAVNICSYDTASTTAHALLMQRRYDVGIADEAHYLKNPQARRTKAVLGARSTPGLLHQCVRFWALTGTPAPNHPGEVYTLCRSLFARTFSRQDGGVMTRDDFERRYCVMKNNGFGMQVVGGKNLAELREKLQPHMLRRKKAEVLTQLPPIRYGALPLDVGALKLPPEETEVAQAALSTEDPLRALEAALPHLSRLRRVLGLAKAEAVAAVLTEELNGGLDKVVVFAQHTDVIKLLASHLSKVSVVSVVTGDMDAKQRHESVTRFQETDECRVFIGQLQAAGTGLTLTAASNLVFAEYSWVPAENQQAAMRIHRIGQENPVLIRFAVVAGSLDERIAEAVRRKQSFIKQVFN